MSADAVTPETKVLLARFHPLADDREVVVVGLVVCAPEGARLKAPPSTESFVAPASLLIKLRYLVEHAAPDPFERLRKLRSQFWSFIEVVPVEKESNA